MLSAKYKEGYKQALKDVSKDVLEMKVWRPGITGFTGYLLLKEVEVACLLKKYGHVISSEWLESLSEEDKEKVLNTETKVLK